MFFTLGETILAITTQIQIVLFSHFNFGATVWSAKIFHVSLDGLIFIDSLVHVYNLSICGVRGYIWLNLYFPEDIKSTKV